MNKFLIAGLGNLGVEYAGTRHNIGFDVADALVQKHETVFQNERLAARAEFKWKGKTVICIKPTTFMNNSGKALKYWMDREKIPVEATLTVLDELALPLSKLRLRPAGSDAGHNGLKSIQEVIGSDNFPKLRFGIGNNFPRGFQVDYVLGRWNEEELPLVKLKINKAVEIIESFLVAGIGRTMNDYNKLSITL